MWTYTKKSDGTIKLTGYDKTAAIVPKGELIIPDKYDGYVVSEIGYECLRDNNDIESVIIPGSVKTIGDRAFHKCKNLTNVVLPEGLKELGYSVFYGCGLENVVLPESLVKAGSSAFANNTAMTTAVIKGKTEFAQKTFADCSNLISVEFHNVINTLPESMFENCVKLQIVHFSMKAKTL